MEEILKEYYLTNDTGGDKTITLSKEGECGVFSAVDSTQLAPVDVKTQIVFPSDGVYDVYLEGSLVGTAKYYPDLFNSAITYISSALCNDFATNCNSHTSCTGEDINVLNNAYSKLMLYVSSYATKYDEAIIVATTKIRCSAKEEWEDILKQENILGVSDTTRLLKIQLSHLYMEMYSVDKSNESALVHDELDELYNYSKTIRCITTLGVRDCDPVLVGGALHDAEFSIEPIEIKLGEPNTINVTYKFTANDDVFVSVLDTNVPNLSISDFDGFTHIEAIAGETLATEYYITYNYERAGITLEKTVSMSTIANPPQWFGAESTVDDYAGVGGEVLISTLKADILNTSPKYQSTSNSTSSNTGTSGKYLWWVTTVPVKFLVGGFEIPVGPWNESCDPNSYAIISKQMVTVMEDGITEVTMNYYRTCPLQELYGQTLAYTINEL